MSEYLGHMSHMIITNTVEFKSYQKFELLRVKFVRKWTGWVEFMGGFKVIESLRDLQTHSCFNYPLILHHSS